MAEQLPDHRMREMAENFRKLQEENARLRGTIDAIAQRQAQPAPVEQEDPFQAFDPKIAAPLKKAVQNLVEQRVSQERSLFQKAYNNLYENFDELKFKNDHPDVNYDDYKGKIEALKETRQRQGQYLSRDEAFKFIAYEERQKKEKENPPPKPVEKPEPKYDPYLQQYVIPEQAQPQTPQVADTTQAQPPQAKPGEAARMGPVVTNDGVQNQRSDDISLPPAGDMRSSAPAASTRPPIGIDLARADDANLKAFEERFGDVPL